MYCDVVAVREFAHTTNNDLRLFRVAVFCRRAGMTIAASTLRPRHSGAARAKTKRAASVRLVGYLNKEIVAMESAFMIGKHHELWLISIHFFILYGQPHR